MLIDDFRYEVQPWVVKHIGDANYLKDTLARQFEKKDLFILNGLNMTKFDGLYDEFTKIFKFPGYFGRNLNALDECINDLEWLNLDILIVLVLNGESVLREESDAGCETIIEIFEDAGAEWSKPIETFEQWARASVPFHAIIQTEKEGVRAIDDLPNLEL